MNEAKQILVGTPNPVKFTFLQRLNQGYTLDPNSGCHVWNGGKVKGYGNVHRSRKHRHVYAHRLSWELNRGMIPQGLCVLHKCDNRPCVNPDHLFLGTYRDNNYDARIKGRHSGPKGETHPYAKLSERDVIEIRASAERTVDLALKYGVVARTIWAIQSKRTWKHLA